MHAGDRYLGDVALKRARTGTAVPRAAASARLGLSAVTVPTLRRCTVLVSKKCTPQLAVSVHRSPRLCDYPFAWASSVRSRQLPTACY